MTTKTKAMSPNLRAITRLAKEVRDSEVSAIVIVHGGGSYGHPLAKKYRIAEGLTDKSQLLGFCKTHEAMVTLNKLIVKALTAQGFPAFGMGPSSFVVTKGGRIEVLEMEPLIQATKTGLTPVLYGDPVLDYDKGFAILSGDQIAAMLAVNMNARRLIMGVDVDGLYTSDPKKHSSAKLIKNLTLADLHEMKDGIGGTNATDVTGGMLGKVLELTLPIDRGIETMIINALEPGRVRRALKGEESIGTEIVKG